MRRALLLAVVLPFAVQVLYAGDYQKSFVDGIRAKEQKNWQQVIARMSEATAEKSSEGGQVRMPGMFVEGYYPHFYLGLAYYSSGNLAAALKEFQESERQGAIRSNARLYDSLKDMRQKVESQLGAEPAAQAEKEKPKEAKEAKKEAKEEHAKSGADPAVVARASERARSEITHAEELARSITQSEESPLVAPVWQRENQLQARQNQAAQKIAAARAKLQSGNANGDPLDLDSAAALATTAAQEYEAVRQELFLRKIAFDKEEFAKKAQDRDLTAKRATEAKTEEENQRKAAAAAERQTLTLGLQQRIDAARKARLAMLARAPHDDQIKRRAADLKRLADDATTAAPAAPVQELRRNDEKLAAAIQGANDFLSHFAQTAQGPPPELMNAASAYFAGDYPRTIALLQKAAVHEDRAAAHGLLLRSAARYALYFVSGQKDPHLLELAASDARACHRRNGALAPLRSAFSPAFTAFFRKNG